MELDTQKFESIPPEQHGRVMAHLDRVLLSTPFATSQRSRSFLKYVVEESLRGNAAQIKERNIAIDVFGKKVDFDPQEESTVRVAAGEVRRRLLLTYQSDLEDGVHIELPVGSYCPKFNVNLSASTPQTVSFAAPVIRLTAKSRHTAPNMQWFLLATLSLVVCVGMLLGINRAPQPLDAFWTAFTVYKQPVVLVLPTPTVFVTTHSESGSVDANGLQQMTSLTGSGGYTGIGAGLGAARFAEQLAKRKQTFTLRSGKNASYSDLQQAPAILFGATSSGLGMQMTNSLRFRIIDGAEKNTIEDTMTVGRSWSVPKGLRTEAQREGYALITFVRRTATGYPVLIVAGLSPADTQAAAQFMTDSESLQDFARNLPKGWAKHNFQLVVHENIFEGSPDRSTITSWQSF
jgi:hypothetical protein